MSIKNTNLCVDLKTVMQKDAILKEGKSYKGVLTRDDENHYLFEEYREAINNHQQES